MIRRAGAVAVEQLFGQTFQRATVTKGRGMKREFRVLGAELETFQQTANRIVIASGKKCQAALPGAKN